MARSSGGSVSVSDVVNELKEAKIKEIKDAQGYTAFHLGAFHGRTEICRYFVEDLGFEVDFLTAEGQTPLFHAAMGGHLATARYPVSQGASSVVPDKDGLTPLHYAAKDGQRKLVKYLLSLGVSVDIRFSHACFTPLMIAAQFGRASVMEVLLGHHANVNGTTSNDITPLLLSVCSSHLECTKLLIKAGTDLNMKCPLSKAIQRNFIAIIKCLLESGADPNVRNENKEIMEKNLADLKVKGADSFKKKEYWAAAFFYCEAIEIASMIGSDDAALFSNRSLRFLRLGIGEWALMEAVVAQSLRPEWPKAYYRIGAACMLLKEYEKACQAFTDGLRLDPTNREMKEAHREAVDCLRKSPFGGRKRVI
ncbi:hypothetical protein LUZ63_021032 [Rhynchospora breviuscula]|uniref:Ankyrin repeat protein n=1 Tax=Rhynchospora breviuscula TaxID=2022672 RepID=A0A9Q0BZ25_9POAL|nr:hypothetical protein LUZ63_021032 [Rhynchospora breviuscula]